MTPVIDLPIIDPSMVNERQNDQVVVSIEQVSKKFCRSLQRSLFYGVQDVAAEILGQSRRSDRLRPQEFWALQDISFQLHRGEALGLVGANGAGKSTLLRIISGLIKPDTGRVRVCGRVAPLIALGAGFAPILTGRENVYANMSILGLSTREIQRCFDDVVDFAEIGEAINAPVQTYSSGMAARLGFSCAVHIQPDILLIDEVLAVGDIKFRMKCHRRLAKLREGGTAFILVTHNPPALLNVCQTAAYLSRGQLLATGAIETVVRQYETDLCLGGTEPISGVMHLPEKSPETSQGIDITRLCFRNAQGQMLSALVSGEFAALCIECRVRQVVPAANVCITITSVSGEQERVLYLTSGSDRQTFSVGPGRVEFNLQMPYCGLSPGLYSAKVFIKQGPYSFDAVESFRFTVQAEGVMSQSLFYQPRDWKVWVREESIP